MAHKYCYLFSEGNATMRELLGGKGANLAEMTNIGLPVPQGFTISTEACTKYYEDGRKINDEIMAEIINIYRPIFTGFKNKFTIRIKNRKGNSIYPCFINGFVRSTSRTNVFIKVIINV